MNVLIVEPSRVFQAAIGKIFEIYSTNIYFANSGKEALEMYSSVRVDMICVSFYLPDMDGAELVSDVRNLKFGETVQVLMITSKKSQEAIIKSLTSGVTEIFRKNNLDELGKYLKKFAEHARQLAHIEGNILIIDKDQKQASELRDFFKDTKLKFIHFTTAEEATELTKAAEFDLVITDVVLDGSMTGLMLIREIREINETMYRVPILVISTILNISQKIGILRAGANDYIQKPILLEELSIRVKNLLHNKQLFDTVEEQRSLLEKLASRDQLTGLYNRYYMNNIVEKAIKDSYRYNYPFSVLYIDLDHFKKINDSYGHSIGDVVLKSVSKLLLSIFRGGDTPVRMGGEEFIILLPHCDGTNAVNRAQSLLSQIRGLRPANIYITASIGVTEIPRSAQIGSKELFVTADEAVYAAKKNGRNCVIFHEVVV